jgi:hypothetical protein
MKQKRERKGKEIDAVFGGNIEEKAEVASAKVEERQQAKARGESLEQMFRMSTRPVPKLRDSRLEFREE